MAGRYNPEKDKRRSIRMQGYDYSRQGAYFVTICTWQRECLFGDISDMAMRLNAFGKIAEMCLKEIPDHFSGTDIDDMMIMPNHVHMILIINGRARRGVACNARTCNARTCNAPTRNAPTRNAPTGNGNYYSNIAPKRNTLSTIIRSYKSAVTKQINIIRNTTGFPVWQRNYYERIIRNESEMNRFRQYIVDNPLHWNEDKNNPANYMKPDFR